MPFFKHNNLAAELRPVFLILHFFLVMLCLLSGSGTARAQAYNWKPVVINGGGYVDGIVFHPNAPGLMYCRTDIGGAYRWNPANNSWTQLLNFVGYPNNQGSLMGVESIGLDPQDTNRLYLACGWMGGSNPSGIMISTNQGASFTVINSQFVIESNNDGRGSGERFGVDPNLGSILFYGTHLVGLVKSVNYAQSWTKVASFPVSTTANGVGIVFVEFIKSSGTPGSATPVIWVGVSQGGTNLFRSTDGGSTWAGINTNGVPAGYMPHHAAQDGLGNMYITFCDAPGPNGVGSGVVRKFNLTTLTSINVTPPTGQGGFGGVTVDQQNPNTVAVSTIDCWWPQNYIYRSTNGGTNWTQTYAGNTDCSSGPWMGNGGLNVQGWSDDLKIDPFNSDHLFWTSGGGVFSSFNFTAAQPSWQFRSDGIEEMVFCTIGSDLACPPGNGPQLLSVFGDIGGFAHYNLDVSPPKTNCFNPGGGNNYGIDFAELNPNLVVRTYYTSGRSGYISTDSGSTWTQFTTEPAAAATNGPGVVVISADGSRLVWAIPGSPSFYSTNHGVTWTQCAGSNPTPPNTWEQPYPFSDRVNSNKFYIYMPDSGAVYVSTNGGASFFAGAAITGSWDSSMHTTYGYEGHVWVTTYDGLWRSTNSGLNFFKVSGVQAAHTVGFGKSKNNGDYPVIYLHGEINNTWGVYRSDDQGTNWTRINDDQHQYGGIQQVIGDPKIYGRCYIAALGIVYGDLPNQPPFTPAGLTASPSAAAISLAWNPASLADSYLIGRSTISGGPYTNIASGVTATSYLDTGLNNGTTYYYVVTATNAYGSSSNSIEAGATPADTKALYAFEGNALDTSGNGFNGTPTAVTYVAGKVGSQAAQFNGTSSYVLIPRSISNDFSVAMWIKTTDTAGSAGGQWWSGKGLVDGEVAGAAADWGTAIVGGKFVLGVGASTDTTIASSVSVNDGTWHHVTATRNNTSGAMAVYVDGVLNGSGTGATGTRSAPPSLRIGCIQTGNNFLSGTIDDVHLYDRVLTTNEIAVLIAPPAVPANLVATIGDASVALSWSASANAQNYYIKRSTTSGSGYTSIATNASLAFTDTGLSNGTVYFYAVSAVDAFGESANSTEVSARPTSLAPTALGFVTAGNQLQLNWPADHTGWQLQSQTNNLGTNWVNVTSSAQTNQVTLPVDTANGAVFFRLVRPY